METGKNKTMDFGKYKPKAKGILEGASDKRSPQKEKLGHPIGVRLTPNEKIKLQKEADSLGIGQLSTTIRALLRKHGYI